MKPCTGDSRHINIRYLFSKDRVESKKCQFYTAAKNTYLQIFTKALQGALLETFSDLIMGWKQLDTLHIGPPSTNKYVESLVKIVLKKKELNPA